MMMNVNLQEIWWWFSSLLYTGEWDPSPISVWLTWHLQISVLEYFASIRTLFPTWWIGKIRVYIPFSTIIHVSRLLAPYKVKRMGKLQSHLSQLISLNSIYQKDFLISFSWCMFPLWREFRIESESANSRMQRYLMNACKVIWFIS